MINNSAATVISSAASVDVVCSTVGLVVFTIAAMFGNFTQTQMYVTVEKPACYQWYFVAANDFTNPLTFQNILEADGGPFHARAWIIDTSTADASELNNSAIEPSQVIGWTLQKTSIQLTKGYASVGLVPLLKGWENICCWEREITYLEEKG